MMHVTPYPNPLPHHRRRVRAHGWRSVAGWVLPSLALATTWVGVCQLVESLLP
jgi:hypothetical protein